jgi:hypothetical protein
MLKNVKMMKKVQVMMIMVKVDEKCRKHLISGFFQENMEKCKKSKK